MEKEKKQIEGEEKLTIMMFSRRFIECNVFQEVHEKFHSWTSEISYTSNAFHITNSYTRSLSWELCTVFAPPHSSKVWIVGATFLRLFHTKMREQGETAGWAQYLQHHYLAPWSISVMSKATETYC